MRAPTLCIWLCLVFCSAVTLAKPSAPKTSRPRVHRVAKGHTLGKIAARYRVSVAAICHANAIGRKARLAIGRRLYIPRKEDSKGVAARRYRDQKEAVADKAKEKKAKGKSPDRAGAPGKKNKVSAKTKKSPNKYRWHRVYKGQRMGTIARRYRVSLAALLNANGIDSRAKIRPGQQLIVPRRSDKDGREARAARFAKLGKKDSGSAVQPKRGRRLKKSYARYLKKTKRRGYLVINGRRWKWRGQLVDAKGRLPKSSRKAMSRVMATASGKRIEVHPRLLKLLAKVSDAFGGRSLQLVSGYRLGSTSKTSRHRQGRAIDFRIAGVPTTALRDFLKEFERVGVGYYPKSQFVHLDVRTQWTYWIDYSGSGQPAQYGGFWVKHGNREVAVNPR